MGLLQLNDKRKGQFSSETIALWERLADYLAIALAKMLAEESLSEAYEKLQVQSEELQTQSEEIQVQNEELQSQSEKLQRANKAVYVSECRERERAEELTTVLDFAPLPVIIVHDPDGTHMTGNRATDNLLRLPSGAKVSLSAPDEIKPPHFKAIKDGRELRIDELPTQRAARGVRVQDFEFTLVFDDGTKREVVGYGTPLWNEEGQPRGAINILVDITERKQMEEAIKKARDTLEEKIKERTSELEKAYNLLKESKKSLSEAQKMAHIGNWDLDIVTREVCWSDELYRIFKLNPKEFDVTYDKILNLIHPEDRDYVVDSIKEAFNEKSNAIDYRIILTDGEERTVHTYVEVIFNEENTPVRIRGTVQDITERKKAEEALEKIEVIRKQEIHHRIKNNLQVISSLLDLQAEAFNGKKDIKDSEVLQAFKESQDRVISMALIHEELHKGEELNTTNFSQYIDELTDNLFLTYRLGNDRISLDKIIDENIRFDMDTSVPLGIITNELVSNSLKYAFVGRDNGEIRIQLQREESESSESSLFTLIISDNGVGIPEDIDIEDLDSLGLQLVTTLVDQLDGELELKRDGGTEFIIRFTVTENSNQASTQAPQVFDND